MRFENAVTHLTPPEANFVEEVCRVRRDQIAMSARDVVRAATLDWSLSVLPRTVIERFQGSHIAYIVLKSQALTHWEPKQGEVIGAPFTPYQLEAICGLARVGIQDATRKAGAVDSETEYIDFLADLYDPEHAGCYELAEDDEANYRSRQFEEYFAAISVGETIVTAITERLG
jgi:hypothetical protein